MAAGTPIKEVKHTLAGEQQERDPGENQRPQEHVAAHRLA